jgi:hypothetical protein
LVVELDILVNNENATASGKLEDKGGRLSVAAGRS